MEQEAEKWFKNWFDSKYYHLLYSNRNHDEAAYFIDNLFEKLQPKVPSKVLDVACGKGRHALHVHSFGHEVHGIDLSEQSIASAKEHQTKKLHFSVHDMREVYLPNKFDICLNLFTSFGYFLKEEENQLSINAMSQNLKSNGLLVLDYLNVNKALQNIPSQEEKSVDDLDFQIKKDEWNGFIRKAISFNCKGTTRKYYEYVKIIRKEAFYAYFSNAGLRVKEIFGDYCLEDFDPQNSDRLIFIAEKV